MSKWFIRHAWRLALVAGLTAMLGLAVACGDDDDATTGTPTGTGAATTAPTSDGKVEALIAPFFPQSGRVILREAIEQGIIDKFIFTDGTKSQSMFDEIGVEPFEGMWGTQPGAPNDEFATAFAATGQDPNAPYVQEGYDNAYLLALAAASANSTDGTAIRDNLRFVANAPGEPIGIGSEEFARAVGLLAAGEDIDYGGATGVLGLDENGDLSAGAIGTWRIVDGLIKFQEARAVDLAAAAGTEVPSGSQVRSDTPPTEPLKLGSIMSNTGDLADFGPPIEAAIKMAIEEINAGGGVFGQDVILATADDGTLPAQGQSEATRLIDVEGVHAIIGALSSDVTLAISENVASPANVVVISPASTAASITTANDNDFTYRTPIQDAAQAEVLADLADEQGFKTVCVLYVNTSYGQGLSEAFTKEFEALGGSVANQVSVEAQQTTYVAELQACVGG